MADITLNGTASLASPLPPEADQMSDLTAGEDLLAFQPCYIKATDGLVYKATGAAATDAAQVHGYPIIPRKAGQPVSLYAGPMDVYLPTAAGLTPGKRLYLTATAITTFVIVADAATTGGVAPIGHTVDGSRARMWASRY